ncbi:hypothetical protein PNI0076_02054, partial [Streptococcus pneumoniae PNI0076]
CSRKRAVLSEIFILSKETCFFFACQIRSSWYLKNQTNIQ